jgi:hypothetical protein
MKNSIYLTAKSSAIVLVVLFASITHAQMNSGSSLPGPNGTLQLSVSIPDQWKESIIRLDENNVTTFKFINGDAPYVFLFSVNKIQTRPG